MAINVKILADSVAPNGARLTTFELSYPRFIHSEIMTHRMLSRNSASSRAIPTEKLIQRVIDDPVVPTYIGKNQKGMAPGEELTDSERAEAVEGWLHARDFAVKQARYLLSLGVHKGVVNRLVEPWMWITVIVSATEWDNFFALRDHEMAEPHFQDLARKMRAAMAESKPRHLDRDDWHLPMIGEEDVPLFDAYEKDIGQGALYNDAGRQSVLAKVAVGRCARVSYLTHAGKRDLKEDIALHDKLIVQRPLHASPAEHVAQAQGMTATWSGNFFGFTQYRKTVPHENVGRAP
ncbi:MAG TPA: FAD-dependent thymidylate synthase [Vicinamibacterales bacterium]|jgi:hypothetical protein|nr:FAD-dependent thymidylate synthase [Vicinamibacterales bacterium]